MSCCGNKRAQLAQQPTQPRRRDVSASVDVKDELAPRPSRLFEYVGSQGLVLRGVVSGATYRFTHPGICLEVTHEDSFAMLAEREIRLKT